MNKKLKRIKTKKKSLTKGEERRKDGGIGSGVLEEKVRRIYFCLDSIRNFGLFVGGMSVLSLFIVSFV